MIVGITGKKYSGKSSAADKLCDHGFWKLSFAEPIKSMLSTLLRYTGMTPFDIRMLETDKEAYIKKLDSSYRELLQTLGTEWGRNSVDPDIWVKCAENAVNELPGVSVVFDDVRFENEADMIRKKGGLIIHLLRPAEHYDKHQSEQGISVNKTDVVITNDGTFESLMANVYGAVDVHF